MPRLLLVDDNPSIHKIAETLLASTDVELVCTESAAHALDRIGRGEHFDAALLDTHMMGMDGWQLLEELRRHPSTARIPIAMMAGVLDEVDPKRIQAAPIQAFLKKPVELRDLGQRVHQLLQSEVALPEAPRPPREQSPFATMPGTRLEDLELDPTPSSPVHDRWTPADTLPAGTAPAGTAPAGTTPAGTAPAGTTPAGTAPAGTTPAPLDLELAPTVDESDDDLLVLTDEDLFPEEIAVEIAEGSGEAPAALDEEPLELEELDLNGIRSLAMVDEGGDEVPAVDLLQDSSEPLAAPWPDLGEPSETSTGAPQVVTSDLPDLGAAEPVSYDLAREAPVPESSITEDLLVLEDWATPPEERPEDLGPTLVLEEEAAETRPAEEEEEDDVDLDLDADPVAPPLPPTLPAEPFAAALPSAAMLIPAFEHHELPPPAAHEELPPAFAPHHEVAPASAHHELPQASAHHEVAQVEATPVLPPPPPSASVPSLSGDAAELARVIAQDPALLDALAKAVVARLGDKVLREIAWEVIPDLAERMRRP